jgi:hypothetical protein
VTDEYVYRQGRRIAVETLDTGATQPPKKKSTGGHFVKVPLFWLDRLGKAARPASTYPVALHLLYVSWKAQGRPVYLSNVALTVVGISPRAKWRALGELERLGLIEVERQPGRTPKIVLVT